MNAFPDFKDFQGPILFGPITLRRISGPLYHLRDIRNLRKIRGLCFIQPITLTLAAKKKCAIFEGI